MHSTKTSGLALLLLPLLVSTSPSPGPFPQMDWSRDPGKENTTCTAKNCVELNRLREYCGDQQKEFNKWALCACNNPEYFTQIAICAQCWENGNVFNARFHKTCSGFRNGIHKPIDKNDTQYPIDPGLGNHTGNNGSNNNTGNHGGNNNGTNDTTGGGDTGGASKMIGDKGFGSLLVAGIVGVMGIIGAI